MNEELRCKPSEPQQSEGLTRCADRVLIALRLLRVGSNVTAAISALEAPKESTLPRIQSLWEAAELLRKANAELASALSVALDYFEKSTAQSVQGLDDRKAKRWHLPTWSTHERLAKDKDQIAAGVRSRRIH
jgi:hypothetical protein